MSRGRIHFTLSLACFLLAGCVNNESHSKGREVEGSKKSNPDDRRPEAEPEPHPLDPLSREELTAATALLKSEGKFQESEAYVCQAFTHEPPKAEVLAFTPGQSFRREAFLVVLFTKKNETFEAVVDLRGKKLLSWTQVQGAQPAFSNEELGTIAKIVRADPRWQAAVKKRGVADLEKVYVDVWAAGTHEKHEVGAPRVAYSLTYYPGDNNNPLGRPVEGVVALTDLNKGQVLRLDDHSPTIPIPY
jgi:primary-amine oxidase